MSSSFNEAIASLGYKIHSKEGKTIIIVKETDLGASFILFDNDKKEVYGSFGPTCLIHTASDIDKLRKPFEDLQGDLDMLSDLSGYSLLVG